MSGLSLASLHSGMIWKRSSSPGASSTRPSWSLGDFRSQEKKKTGTPKQRRLQLRGLFSQPLRAWASFEVLEHLASVVWRSKDA